MAQETASVHSDDGARKLARLDEALISRGIHVHYTTWLRLIRRKGLPAVKVGGRYYVDLDDLDRWLCAQSVVAQSVPSVGVAPKAMRPQAADAVLAVRRRSRQRARLHAEGGRS